MNSWGIESARPQPEHKWGYKYLKAWETKPWACQDRHKGGHRRLLAFGAWQYSSLHTLKGATPGWS